MMKLVCLLCSHVALAVIGFAAGIYALPIMTDPGPPSAAALQAAEGAARFTGEFRRDLPGSDFLHWGQGEIAVGPAAISLRGELAPGPDYKLYLSPEPVTTAHEFEAVKAGARRIGDVRAFHGFVAIVPADVDVEQYRAVVIWCETFHKFITAATYR